MLIVADVANSDYLKSIRNLPYRVCDTTQYLHKLATELCLDYDLEPKLHQALKAAGLSSRLKINFAISHPADIVLGLSLQEAIILNHEIQGVILYPQPVIPHFQGVAFFDLPDLLTKIEALI